MFQTYEIAKPVVFNPERVKRQEHIDELLLAAEQRVSRRARGHRVLSFDNDFQVADVFNVGVSSSLDGEQIDQEAFENVFMSLHRAPVPEQRQLVANGYATARMFWRYKLLSGALNPELKKVAVARIMLAQYTQDYWMQAQSVNNWKS